MCRYEMERNVQRLLFEMCETELDGEERYGYLGGCEKYRQHLKYFTLFENEKTVNNYMMMVGEWLYLRQYLKCLSLKSSVDQSPFSGEDLMAAAKKVEMVEYVSIEDAKEVFGCIVKEWSGGTIKKHGRFKAPMYKIKPNEMVRYVKAPPANSIVTMDGRVIFPSVGCEWMKPPDGETDAYYEHHSMKTSCQN